MFRHVIIITDMDTWTVTYEIDVKMTPGCGDYYWVGFGVSAAPPKFHRKLYEKDDVTKTSIIGVGQPTDADHNNWGYWIPDDSTGMGPGEQHFYAILEVWSDEFTPNGQQATITVDVWSCDEVPNDLEHRVVTTISTVNIPNGIRMYHSVPFRATQWVQPGEWAEFDITIKDIGEAYGTIDLSKDPMSSDCLEDTWEYQLPASAELQEANTVEFTLKVKPPVDAEDDDYAVLIVSGQNHDNAEYKHTVAAKTIVAKPKPDLAVRDDTGVDNIELIGEDYTEGETYDLSIDVYNLGDMPVSNFEVNFKLSTIGMQALIGKTTVTDTLNPDNYINLQMPWKAIVGSHSLCVHLDEDNLIKEWEEDSNNEAGLVVEVGEPKPKNIELSMDLDPTSCMPGEDFIVSGDAKYNPEYGSVPVDNADIKISIKEIGKSYNAKTDANGEYSVTCKAPTDVGIYNVEVIASDGVVPNAVKKEYLTVATFQVSVMVSPQTVITGNEITLSGNVMDKGSGVPDADYTISILDSKDIEVAIASGKTTTVGMYTEVMTSPEVTEYSDFNILVTATKDDITGKQDTILFVDIDTDVDGIGNQIDDDDDGDGYPDTIETPLYDPLDKNDAPYPFADAGDDQTINEGTFASFEATDSISPVGLPLDFLWDFGDDSGETSPEERPRHKYYSDGEYTVTLTVKDEYKGTDSTTITVTVEDLGPSVSITGPSSGEAGTSFDFTANELTSQPDKIVKYEWDWDGDNVFDEEFNVNTAKHSWSEDSTYTITLRATDSDGSTGTTTLKITITPKPKDKSDTSDTGAASAAVSTVSIVAILIVIVIVVLLALLFISRKNKANAAELAEQRIDPNINAQASRRPTTQFATADIKPSLAPPGTIPPQQISAPVQQTSALPPAQTSQPQEQQRDWNWNFNE
jgi:PKD repeat protein